jgi:hypothetical protein
MLVDSRVWVRVSNDRHHTWNNVATFVGEGMVKERVEGHMSEGEGDNVILAPDCGVVTRIQAIERRMHLGVVKRAQINNQTPLMSGNY